MTHELPILVEALHGQVARWRAMRVLKFARPVPAYKQRRRARDVVQRMHVDYAEMQRRIAAHNTLKLALPESARAMRALGGCVH